MKVWEEFYHVSCVKLCQEINSWRTYSRRSIGFGAYSHHLHSSLPSSFRKEWIGV